MKKILRFYFLCSISIFIFSCSNDDFEIPLDTSFSEEITTKTEDQCIEEMAMVLNSVVSNPQIFSSLKEEALKQIDGDFDVVLAKSLSKDIVSKSGVSLFDLINDQLLKTKTMASYDFDEFVDHCKRQCPLLQIYMPDDQDFSNMSDFITVILFPNFKDGKDNFVQAFNSKGEIVSISALEEPEVPYMVVGLNERFDLMPDKINTKNNLEQGPYFTTEYYAYYLPDMFKKKQQQGTKIQNKNTRASRNPNDKEVYEVVSRARFMSRDAIRNVESWMRGKPEVEARIIFHQLGSLLDFVLGASTVLSFDMGEDNWYTGKRRKPNPCNNYGNWKVVRWVPLAKKTKMKYIFVERDNGFSISINNNLTISLHGGDNIGEQYVYWGDNINKIYPVSNVFEFEVGQKYY
jgi:hypothetical protein